MYQNRIKTYFKPQELRNWILRIPLKCREKLPIKYTVNVVNPILPFDSNPTAGVLKTYFCG